MATAGGDSRWRGWGREARGGGGEPSQGHRRAQAAHPALMLSSASDCVTMIRFLEHVNWVCQQVWSAAQPWCLP